MHNVVESRRVDYVGGGFAWVVPLVLVVLLLALSWAGLFVVMSDMIDAASRVTISANAVHE